MTLKALALTPVKGGVLLGQVSGFGPVGYTLRTLPMRTRLGELGSSLCSQTRSGHWRVGGERYAVFDAGSENELAAAAGTMKDITNMRRTLFSALMLCLMAIPSILPEAQEESEADQVRALEVKLMDCYKQRQLDLLASLLDNDFVITVEDGSIYGKTGYISYSSFLFDACGYCRDVRPQNPAARRHCRIDRCVPRTWRV